MALKRPTIFNLSHQVEYELNITEQCTISNSLETTF